MRPGSAYARGCLGVLAAFALLATVDAAGPRLPLGLDLYRPVPKDNQPTPARVDLGERLFRDRGLSRDGAHSCASCHDPRRAFTDGRATGIGIGGATGTRNVPTLVNRAWGQSFFWDGRADSLETQVLEPIFNPRELAMTRDGLSSVIGSPKYRRTFREAFGDEPTIQDTAKALASYVRTILSGDSPYDRYLHGKKSALTASAIRGLAIFQGKGGCSSCHAGPTFTDEQFHNTGVAWRSGALIDEGRGAVTGIEAERGAFKTPTLREVARTAPYTHDGSIPTLEEVIEFYDRGGIRNPSLDFRIRPLQLSAVEKTDLRMFLEALSGKVREGR